MILEDEKTIPSMRLHWRQGQMDITMMACVAAVERTEKKWQATTGIRGSEDQKDLHVYRGNLE